MDVDHRIVALPREHLPSAVGRGERCPPVPRPASSAHRPSDVLAPSGPTLSPGCTPGSFAGGAGSMLSLTLFGPVSATLDHGDRLVALALTPKLLAGLHGLASRTRVQRVLK